MTSEPRTTVPSELGDRMRALADSGHPRAEELREKAAAFDAANPANAGEEWSAKRMMGAWARARRLWCDCTGEPLI